MRLNNSHSSFTLLELLVVIVIIGILASTISFNFAPDNLQLAADNLIKNIHLAKSLALKDDKYQPFPIIENSIIENNRSKYWFKQWWQIRFTQNTTTDNHYWYEIFTDQPTDNKKVFDGYGYTPSALREVSLAKNPLNGKYLIGNCNKSGYPDCNKTDSHLDLTKSYGIKKIEYNNLSAHRLIFDNFGNIFLKEGQQQDDGDINPLDESNRPILTKNAAIKLCLDNPCQYTVSHCIQINITPSGYIYKSQCN